MNIGYQVPKVQKGIPHRLDPMKRALVEPIMALTYAEEIGLSASQRAAIEDELDTAKMKFRTLEEKLSAETATMFELLNRPTVSEKEALEQLDRILELEKQIKQVNLLCSLRVRMHLKPAQRERLMQLPLPPPPPPPPPLHVPQGQAEPGE